MIVSINNLSYCLILTMWLSYVTMTWYAYKGGKEEEKEGEPW